MVALARWCFQRRKWASKPYVPFGARPYGQIERGRFSLLTLIRPIWKITLFATNNCAQGEHLESRDLQGGRDTMRTISRLLPAARCQSGLAPCSLTSQEQGTGEKANAISKSGTAPQGRLPRRCAISVRGPGSVGQCGPGWHPGSK